MTEFDTCNVPQLKPDDGGLVPRQDFEGKIDANGCSIVFTVEIVDVAFDEGGLASAQLANDEHLEEVLGLGATAGGGAGASLLHDGWVGVEVEVKVEVGSGLHLENAHVDELLMTSTTTTTTHSHTSLLSVAEDGSRASGHRHLQCLVALSLLRSSPPIGR